MGLFKKLISSVLGSGDEDAKEELEEKASSLKKGLGNILNAWQVQHRSAISWCRR